MAFAPPTSQGVTYDLGEFLEMHSIRVRRYEDGVPALLMGTLFQQREYRLTFTDEVPVENRDEIAKRHKQMQDGFNFANRESYSAEDNWGNRFTLSFGPEAYIAEKIAMHQFLEVLEVPHIPAYPIFLKRGEFGVPTSDEAKAFFPENRMIGIAGADGQWFPAILEPEILSQTQLQPAYTSRARHIAASTNLVLAWYLLQSQLMGSVGAEKDYVGIVQEVLFPFLDANESKDIPLAQFLWDKKNNLKKLPFKEMSEFQGFDTTIYAREVNRFINRAEHLVRSGDLEKIFNPMLIGLSRAKTRNPGWYPPQYLSLLTEKINSLRKEMEAFLKQKVGGEFRSYRLDGSEDADLRIRGPLFNRYSVAPSPAIVDPGTIVFNHNDDTPSFESAMTEPKKSLYQMAHIPEQTRAKWVETWKAQSSETSDPIAHLLNESRRWDNRVLLLTSQKIPGEFREGDYPVWQTWINRTAPRTLLVLSKNDRESRAVKRIVERIGETANIVLYPAFNLEQGVSINGNYTEPIIRYARDHQCKRVIIFENGRVSDSMKKDFADEELQLLHIDHHGRHGQDNTHKLSAAEQLVKIYRYDPSANELYAFILDRSSVQGVFRAGLTKREVHHVLSHEDLGGALFAERAQNFRQAVPSAKLNSIYEVPNFQGSMEVWSMPIGMTHLPDVPTILLLGEQRIRVNGPAPVVKEIIAHFSALSPERDFLHFGGDVNHSKYFSIAIPYNSGFSYRKTHETIERILREHGDRHGSKICWKTLLAPEEWVTRVDPDEPLVAGGAEK